MKIPEDEIQKQLALVEEARLRQNRRDVLILLKGCPECECGLEKVEGKFALYRCPECGQYVDYRRGV